MLNPSRVEVAAPAPVILAANVTLPEALIVVNAPVEAVDAPIGVLLIEPALMIAPVIVLLVSVSVPAKVARVPVVGNVTLVEAVAVKVIP
jgi:hypothetical protein